MFLWCSFKNEYNLWFTTFISTKHITILGNNVKGCFAEERDLAVFLLINDKFEFHVLTQSGSVKTHGDINVSLAASYCVTVAHDIAHKSHVVPMGSDTLFRLLQL